MRTLNHRPRCGEPIITQWTGHLGDPMLGCATCRAFLVLTPEQAAEYAAQAAATLAPAPADGYTFGRMFARLTPVRLVCREHHDQAVKPNGRGCDDCAALLAAARLRRARRSRRRATRRADALEELIA